MSGSNDASEATQAVSLHSLKPGQRARIRHIGLQGSVAERLLEMGLTPKTPITLQGKTLFGGVVHCWLRGFKLSLQRELAQHIHVEPEAK